eukprot:scaffold45948_cov58-Phaeocystis_antarctica.AAC.1
MRVFPYRVRPLDSAASGCFQPAAELRHLQRHRHELHVRGALPPSPSALTPEPGHTRTPRALLIRPSLSVPSLCHACLPLSGAPSGLAGQERVRREVRYYPNDVQAGVQCR